MKRNIDDYETCTHAEADCDEGSGMRMGIIDGDRRTLGWWAGDQPDLAYTWLRKKNPGCAECDRLRRENLQLVSDAATAKSVNDALRAENARLLRTIDGLARANECLQKHAVQRDELLTDNARLNNELVDAQHCIERLFKERDAARDAAGKALNSGVDQAMAIGNAISCLRALTDKLERAQGG